MAKYTLSDTLTITIAKGEREVEIEVFEVNDKIADLQSASPNDWQSVFIEWFASRYALTLSTQQSIELTNVVVETFNKFLESAKKKNEEFVGSLTGMELTPQNGHVGK
jgi:hypothetical protein